MKSLHFNHSSYSKLLTNRVVNEGYCQVVLYKNKRLVCPHAHIDIHGDRFEVKEGDKQYALFFNKLSAVTVLGRNKLNIYTEERVMQFKGDKHFNALKYVNLYHRYKNTHQEGGSNGEFLGL